MVEGKVGYLVSVLVHLDSNPSGCSERVGRIEVGAGNPPWQTLVVSYQLS